MLNVVYHFFFKGLFEGFLNEDQQNYIDTIFSIAMSNQNIVLAAAEYVNPDKSEEGMLGIKAHIEDKKCYFSLCFKSDQQANDTPSIRYFIGDYDQESKQVIPPKRDRGRISFYDQGKSWKDIYNILEKGQDKENNFIWDKLVHQIWYQACSNIVNNMTEPSQEKRETKGDHSSSQVADLEDSKTKPHKAEQPDRIVDAENSTSLLERSSSTPPVDCNQTQDNQSCSDIVNNMTEPPQETREIKGELSSSQVANPENSKTEHNKEAKQPKRIADPKNSTLLLERSSSTTQLLQNKKRKECAIL